MIDWIEFEDDDINTKLDGDLKYLVTDGYDIRLCYYDNVTHEFFDGDTSKAWDRVKYYFPTSKLMNF
jgi:hypothetical protein